MRLAEKAEAAKLKKVPAGPSTASKFAKGAGKITGKTARTVGKTVFRTAAGIARASGILTLVMMAIDGLIGGFKEGIASFKAGNSGSKVVADFIFGALKGIVQGIKESIELIFVDLPKFALSLGKELFKNFSEQAWPVIKDKTIEFKDYMSDKIDDMIETTKNMFSNTIELIKSSIVNGLKDLINAVVDKTKTRKLLPESVQEFLATPEPVPTVGDLTATSKSNTIAPSMMSAQKAISDYSLQSMLNGGNLGMNQNIMAAPITTNVQNNNVFTGNIKTRNPESPLFIRD